ncbi:unnamed protein product [Cladocopium goreaui]|uniref:Pseudouridylate synthase 7-like n=1 Tax=Cladocopium goreaui TaxID=2562237 RepID=A0A9P1FKM1_9DINO|nr:unnamed protein product [Cladocopium goreaui]
MRRHAPGRVLSRKWSIDRSYSPQCGRPFKDAGITQFLQEEPQGFTAALKRSLFDFQVHEIDLQGEEIHLGAMGPPPTSPDVCDKWYLHFRLYKEGMDTLEATSRLCRFLGRPPQNFRFAGHKDRCAVTVQQLSCTSLEPAKLLGVLEHQDWDHRLAFSHLEIKQNYLNLGDLSGNRFNVVMRQVPMKEPGAGGTTASDLVERRCESLKARGFLNYFGPQRFGSQLIRSDQVRPEINWCRPLRARLFAGTPPHPGRCADHGAGSSASGRTAVGSGRQGGAGSSPDPLEKRFRCGGRRESPAADAEAIQPGTRRSKELGPGLERRRNVAEAAAAPADALREGGTKSHLQRGAFPARGAPWSYTAAG